MIARHHVTGSRVELADAGCLFWARADVDLPRRTDSAASSLGSATHEAAATAGEFASHAVDGEELADALRYATVMSTGLDSRVDLEAIAEGWGLTSSAAEQLGELHATWRAWWIDWLPAGAHVRYEVPFAWDTKTWTARELPSAGPRDYSGASYDEVTCTLDAVVGCPDGSAIVVDLKTGRRHHPAAATHAQLATGALCVASVFGLDTVQVVLAKILPGTVYVDSATLDAATLDARALSLSRYLSELPTSQPWPGRHCAECYCPLLGACDGPRALALRAPDLARAFPIVVETEEQAAAVLGSYQSLQAGVDSLRRSAREWAERNGGRVRMPDGSEMVLRPQTRRTVNVDRVEPVLRSRFGEDMGGLVTLKKSISVTALERAAAALAPPGRTRAAVDARKSMVAKVMGEVDAANGVRVSTWDSFEREVPSAPKLPEVV